MVFYGARRLACTDDYSGLWDEWRDRASGETVKSFTMIITEPNEGLSPKVQTECLSCSSKRILNQWLSGDAGVEYLKPAGNDMLLQTWPVSKRVNSSKAPADDPTLIERVDLSPGLAASG